MLTAKQEKFVQNIIQGMSQADAYRSAYATNKMSDKTIHEAASRLASDSKVSARLLELRQELTKDTIMSAQERLEWLTEFVKTGEKFNLSGDKIRAIDTMNKMTGEYNQRVTATITYEDRLREVVGGDEY